MLNILILGGTQMLGRNLIEHLIQKNIYNIFIANRGITNPSLFLNNCQHIKIDRNDEQFCSILANYSFDIVIDFSCYTTSQFQNTFKFLKYKKYIYISTISVFDRDILVNYDKNNNYHIYRVDKLNCEIYIKNSNISNIIIIRPCAIYGDFDYTNRFYKQNGKFYWKCNNSEVGVGTMEVNDLSKFLMNYINLKPISSLEINACENNN